MLNATEQIVLILVVSQRKISFGRTASYADIAEWIGNSKISRAVSMSNSKNQIPIIVPYHSVIGKKCSLTGFGGGLCVKKQLLQLEESVADGA